jgi:hypothetical protein
MKFVVTTDAIARVGDVVRGLAVLGVAAFLGVLVWYLGRPGYTHVRLAFFSLLGALAVVGAVGVVRRSERLIAASVVCLLAFGFWQAVLWVYVFPVVGLLVAAGVSERVASTPPST